jgi:LEA14-like dessication related protein
MKKAIIILAIVAAVGVGGYLFYQNEIDKLYNMQYQFLGANIKDLSTNGKTILTVKIRLDSDSTLEAAISDMDLDVYIDGTLFGKIESVNNKKPIIIPAKGFSIAEVQVTLDTLQTELNGFTVIKNYFTKKDATLALKGKLKLKTGFLPKFPANINYSESIKYLLS